MSTTNDDNTGSEDGKRILRLTVEYDGTDFAGFQMQARGQRTVQGTLESVIARLSGEASRVHGAGRTDAGVHATGQVIHFRTGWRVPAEKLAVALNAGGLPRDIAVRDGEVAPPGFHARFSATARVYRYTILNRSDPSALLGRFALQVHDPLDLDAMRAGAAELVGVHDFAAFGRPNRPGESTVRRVDRIEVRAEARGSVIRITVQGNAFLRHMVRAFAGTLLQAGLNRLSAADVAAIRDSRDGSQCPSIAPPQGLCLIQVCYSGTRERFEWVRDERNAPSLSKQEQDHEDVFGQSG